MLENYEKKKLLIVERSLKRFVSMQWENLRETILAPLKAPRVHPDLWGQGTITWRRSKPPLAVQTEASEDSVYYHENMTLEQEVPVPEFDNLPVPAYAKKPVPPPWNFLHRKWIYFSISGPLIKKIL